MPGCRVASMLLVVIAAACSLWGFGSEVPSGCARERGGECSSAGHEGSRRGTTPSESEEAELEELLLLQHRSSTSATAAMGGGGGEITKPPGKASAERCRGISCPDFFAAQQSASLQAVRAEEAGLLQADLPVSDNLIAFNTSQGAELLLDNPKELSSYFLMAQHSVMQITQTFCGVATACGQLNSLAGLAAPVDPTYKPYPYFTQAGYFSECVEAVVPEATVRVMGMTLEQWGAAARCWGAEARVVHGSSSSVDTFRDDARQALAGGKQVAVNFYRGGLEQAGGGHFSPLGAYSSSEDRFLLMDVARYKYPMVWVKTAELFDAMNTTDSDAGMSRGYAIVGAREAQGLDIQVGCSAAASR